MKLLSWIALSLSWPAAGADAGRARADVVPTLEWHTKLLASNARPGDMFGSDLQGAGDVDGDGYGDVVVGCPQSFGDGVGAAYVYYGSPSGITPGREDRIRATDDRPGSYFGQAAGAGDLDGDGYDDLVVGAYAARGSTDGSGAAYVFYGSATGVDPGRADKLASADGAEADYFGGEVAGAGDVDGDGYDDLVVGAEGEGRNNGAVYVYHGSPTGIDPSRFVRLVASDTSRNLLFGASVSGAGDVDGDGWDDILVGADGADEGRGAAWVYYGSPTGIDPAREDRITASDGAPADSFGDSTSGAGDVDGDGWDDVVIGANAAAGSRGAAYVYYGSATGIDRARESRVTASDGAPSDNFGNALRGAGDVDGDGWDDIVVGAFGDVVLGLRAGSAYVYHGSATGIDPTRETKLVAPNPAQGDAFGMAVASAGDVNGDGLADLVIGSPDDDELGDAAGAAHVFVGSDGSEPAETGHTGDTGDVPPDDTDAPADTDAPEDTDLPEDTDPGDDAGCGCASADGSGLPGILGLLAAGVARRRRRA